MPKKSKELKTRPDLDGKAWLAWLAEQPENKGVDVQALFHRMLEWCRAKNQQPTRRRLLKWIENTRESVPIDINEDPDCSECDNERRIRGTLESWPCPKCRPAAYANWQKQRGK